MLKVCHIAMGDLWAGAEVQLATLAAELVNRPDVDLAVALFNEGRLASDLRALGVPVTVIPEVARQGLALLQDLIAYCRAGRFDLLHTHKYKDTILGTIAAARCGIPHVVRTMHGLPEPFKGLQAFRMGLYECFEQIAIRGGVDRVIAVSSQMQRLLSGKYGAKKVVQIYNGIRLEQIKTKATPRDIKAQLGIDAEHRIIGTVGRLTAVKGHDQLLAAARRLLAERHNLHFVIVGDGPLLGALAHRARALGLDGHVSFLGHRDDAYDLIGAMDVFVLPSLHEGIPMVILEAMALARPIVASRVGGIPEIINNEVQGLLIPAADPGQLADACRRFLDDPRLAEYCGEVARSRVEREFASELMGRKVMDLYHEVIRNN